MGELVYTPKRGQSRTVVVTGNDGSSHEFVAGAPVDEDKVPEGVRAILGDTDRNIAAPEAASDDKSDEGKTSRGGK